jgi:SAM-dependent methyltransferase
MTQRFLNDLIDEASRPFRGASRFAYHYARAKLSSDSIFREMLRRGLFPATGRYLDLGCGQGSLFAWLLAARKLYELGNWPPDWPPAPQALALRGVELMPKDVDRAARAFGGDHPLVGVEQGDMAEVDFSSADVITILDALHYIDHDRQKDILRRIRGALPPGGVFLTRVGDAAGGLPYHLCNWIDQAVIFVRGHRLPRLYCRRLSEWVELLERFGFVIESEPMNEGKPFANIMLVCRVPK